MLSNFMTRADLISKIMFQVRQATDDEQLRQLVEWKLKLTRTPVLRDIWSMNAVQMAVIRAKENLKSSQVSG
jgi:hypothetical protein